MDLSLGAPLHPANVGLVRALGALGDDASIAAAELLTPTTPADLARVIGEPWFAYDDEQRCLRVIRGGLAADSTPATVLVLDWWRHGPELQVYAIARSPEAAQRLLEYVVALPAAMPEADEAVLVTFWAWSERWGAQARRRALEAGLWETMAGNYPAATRAELEALMGWQAGPGFGQLLLLYGPPGTGKTHAIRALAQAWRPWCEVSYVTDPERFFGSADYMLSVLLDGAPDESDEGGEARWQLVVVEDTDELIRSDGKDRAGQAMSRLLNLCDGLIGQGLRVLVLLTTNEPIDALHPAITRPGRCAARIEAGAFSPEEARAWLQAVGLSADGIDVPCTLADLYARRRAETALAGSAAPIGLHR